MKKALLIFSALVACVAGNFLLNLVVPLPEWFSFFAHFSAGGMLTAWLVLAVWQWRNMPGLRSASSLGFFGTVIAWVAFIGLLWELFEFFVFQRGSPDQSWLYDDTMWDFVMDLIGGMAGVCWYCLYHAYRAVCALHCHIEGGK